MKILEMAWAVLHQTSVPQSSSILKSASPVGNLPAMIRIGFIPVTDCVPLIAAQRLGLFEARGLRVSLHCEVGWATIREKLVHNQLDAAHAVVGLILALRLGLQGPQFPVVAPFVFSLHGNAITLSRDLWNHGVRDAVTLRKLIRSRKDRLLSFGVVSPFSAHHFLLRRWLQQGGIDADRDVRIQAFPPSLMAENLAAGLLDGYCAGEPWNSQAVATGKGWCPALSEDLLPGHPDKALLVSEAFAQQQGERLAALCEVCREACAFCDVKENRPLLAKWLAESGYFTADVSVLKRSLVGPFDNGMGQLRDAQSFHIFSRQEANDPTPARAAWLIQECLQHGLLPADSAGLAKRELAHAWNHSLSQPPPVRPARRKISPTKHIPLTP